MNEIARLIRETVEEMAGFSRVRRMMLGGVDSIDSIGVITAENPQGEPASPEFNQEIMSKLKSDLRSMGYGFINISGKYGSHEKTVLVPNISREQIVSLGQKYDQESVIWGEKKDADDFVYFEWEYIEGAKTVQTRNTSMSTGEVANRDDFFSAVKSRKFVIPFFDEKFANKKPSKNYGYPKSAINTSPQQKKNPEQHSQQS